MNYKKSKDNFPFFAFTSVISPDTPSVNDAQGNENAAGGGGGSANTPVEGLYFFHTDHLDSITMITNTSGEVVAGTSIGSGKSIISYTPYGEIDRDHSGGPDIFRYKYTGQEEDKETGLYYYKARYYDSKIGRFLQPDSVVQTSSPFGTNQYMYVEGNPVMYNDPSGHNSSNPLTAKTDVFEFLDTGYYSHNYTFIGNRSEGYPAEKQAYWFLGESISDFLNIQDPGQRYLINYSLSFEYYEYNQGKGKETVLDKLNTQRKKYKNYLGCAVLQNMIKPEYALLIYDLMTKDGKIKQPINGIDRASYNHDYSDGSNIFRSKARAANDQWIKNAWRGARTPWQYTQAFVGTVLFKIANLHSLKIEFLNRNLVNPISKRLGMCGKKGCKL